MKENIENIKGYVYGFETNPTERFYVTTERTILELENKIYKLQNSIEVTSNRIEAIGFFSLANMLILITYIATKGF